ncbi:hypothetical protein [Thalassotalea fusca]
MRFYLFLLCCCSSLSLWANENLYNRHQQFQQLSNKLHDQFQQQNNHSSLISASSYHYIQGVGGIFIFAFNQPFNSWFVEENAAHATHAISAEEQIQAKAEFHQLRAQAKHLSHQIYGLERKLKSLKQSKNTSDDPQMISRLIEESEAQLEQLTLDKQQLKPKYDHAESRVGQVSNNVQNATTNYLINVEQQLFNHICHNQRLLDDVVASSNESLSFILKQADYDKDFGTRDLVYRASSALMKKCTERSIDENEFSNQLTIHNF